MSDMFFRSDYYLNLDGDKLVNMQKKEHNLSEKLKNKIFSQYSLILVIIIGISCLIRFYYFPTEIPLTADALYYFWYSSDIHQIGALPNNWTPTNNGWPIFVSVFFTILDSKDVFTLMEIQKLLSVVISVLITIPVYFLCKKFVARKFAIIGASLIAFDPRLMINSFLGITDPLYLLLVSTGLTLFLSSNKKLVFCSFALISLSTIIRGEGIIFLIFLFILFFVRYRKEKYKIIFNYIIILIIILLIVMPMTIYRIDVNGNDPIFTRSVASLNEIATETSINKNINFKIFEGLKNFIQFLIWIMIPNFIIFLPLGIFLIFQKKNFEKNTIIISSFIMMIPGFYAYTFPANPALDTRYLYTLFPIFSVLAVLSINRVIGKLNKSNTIIVIIISLIIISSLLFYDYKKIDYDHEKESFEIMKEVSLKVKGVNNLSTESRYLSTIQTINQWPTTYSEIEFNIKIISYQNEDNLQDWISKSKDKGLTHILIDDDKQLPDFLKEVFFEETKYTYLKKIYDSRNQGFDYQLKVFEINYELFESLKR
jgi:hypothetical protein